MVVARRNDAGSKGSREVYPMTRTNPRAKVDANQAEIVADLRKLGASVQSLTTVGKGCPDIVVGYMGVNLMVEIKDGSNPPSRRRLTLDELEWHAEWRGQVAVVKSIEQARALLNGVRELRECEG